MHQVGTLGTEEIADSYGAAWNENDLEAIMGMQGDDMVFQLHAEGFEPAVGPEAVRAQFAYFFDAWEGMHFAPAPSTSRTTCSSTVPVHGQARQAVSAAWRGDRADRPRRRHGRRGRDHRPRRARPLEAHLHGHAGDAPAARRLSAWRRPGGRVRRSLRAGLGRGRGRAARRALVGEHELHQPLLGSLHGREECRRAFSKVFVLSPDLRTEVYDWVGDLDSLYVAFTFHTTLAAPSSDGPAVDRFRISGEGLILRRDSYWDLSQVLEDDGPPPRADGRKWFGRASCRDGPTRLRGPRLTRVERTLRWWREDARRGSLDGCGGCCRQHVDRRGLVHGRREGRPEPRRGGRRGRRSRFRRTDAWWWRGRAAPARARSTSRWRGSRPTATSTTRSPETGSS